MAYYNETTGRWRGKCGEKVYSSWMGIKYVRGYNGEPHDPNSDAQKNVRGVFRRVQAIGRELRLTGVLNLMPKPAKMTPANAFTKLNTPCFQPANTANPAHFRPELLQLLPRMQSTAKLIPIPKVIGAIQGTTVADYDTVTVTLGDSYAGISVAVLIYDPATNIACATVDETARTSKTIQLDIGKIRREYLATGALPAGQVLHVYICLAKAADGKFDISETAHRTVTLTHIADAPEAPAPQPADPAKIPA